MEAFKDTLYNQNDLFITLVEYKNPKHSVN